MNISPIQRVPLALAAVLALAISARAADRWVISVDFNNPASTTLKSGEESGAGTNFSGQLGTWNALRLPTGSTPGTGALSTALLVSGQGTYIGPTLTFNPARASHATAVTGDDPLRRDYVLLDSATDDTLSISINNLRSGAEYDLIFYAHSASLAPDITIGGLTATPDADGDSSFQRVRPDPGSKAILATVSIPDGQASASVAGLQLRFVAPPGITSFTAADTTTAPGTPVTFAWEAEPGVTSIEIDNGVGDVTPLTDGNTGTLTLSPGPAQTTTYTITARSPEGTDTRPLTIQVGPAPVVSAFSSEINPANPTRSRILDWQVSGADSLQIDHGIGTISATGGNHLTLVPPGATWNYLDDGTNQSTAWVSPTFDDSAWESGPAELGYGDNNEPTRVGYGPDASRKFPTTYFRHTFDFTGTSRATALTLDLKYDDGAVVYLNGTELDRYNMSATPVTYLTYASGTVPGDGANFQTFTFPPGLLRDGPNTLAVEIHQSSAASSDISFDLGLAVTTQDGFVVTPPGNRTYTLTATNIYGTTTATTEVVLSAVPLVLYDFSTSPPVDTLSNSTATFPQNPPLALPTTSQRTAANPALTFHPSRRLEIASPTIFPALSESYALALWLNAPPDQPSNTTILNTLQENSGLTLRHTGSPQLAIETHHPGGPKITLVDGFFDNTWHHLAISLTTTALTVYKDGTLISESPLPGTPITPATTWSLGNAHDATSPFTGQLDELVIFDRPLQGNDLTTILDTGAISLLQPIIIDYAASDQTVTPGTPVTLTWSTYGTTSVTLDPPAPNDLPLAGSITVTPTAETTYTLTAHNPYASVSQSTTITTGPAPTITAFTADPDTLTAPGQTATLTWATTGATRTAIDHSVGDVPAQGTTTVAPTSLTTYQLTTENDFGTTAQTTTVTVTNDPAPGAWTLAVIPDTQHYTESAATAPIFTQMTRWIADNTAARNIKFVIHEGDLVQNNTAVEWARARTSMDVLHGVVPYATTNGNHDYGPGGDSSSRATLFNAPTAFGPASNYATQPTLNGNYPDPANPTSLESTYHTFHANGQDYLVLSLEWAPRDAVVAWADQIASQHPNHRIILLVHAYTYDDNTRFNWAARGSGQSGSPYSYGVSALQGGINDGEQLWQKLVRKHEGFSLVCSGHADTVGYVRSPGDHRNLVHQMLFNTQTEANGGDGWIRLLEFHADGRTVDVKTYSPYFDSIGQNPWRIDRRNQFTLQLTPFPSTDTDADGQPDAWETTYGLDPHNPADADLDPNGDGLTNFAAYAFARSPVSTAPTPPNLTTSTSDGQTTISYRRRIPGSSTLTYTLQHSPDLITWTVPTGTEATITNNGDNTETVTVTDVSPTPANTTYYRLQITQP